MDATAWGAIGGGLSALSEGLTAMELRRLAKEKEKEDRERQKEEAALRKAQLKAQEFQNMDARNFKKVSENGQVTNKANANALLNAAAFGRGGEQVKGDISGDTYFRGAGESPADQARAKEEARIQAAMERLQTDTAAKAELDRVKGERDLYKWGTTSGNVQTQETGRNRRWDTVSGNVGAQQAGANTRASTPRPSRSASTSTAGADRRRAAILSMTRKLAESRYDRETMETVDGLPWEEAVAKATQIVDAADGKPTANGSGGAGRTEDQEAERARQKIAEIISDASLSAAEKQARIDQVDQLLQRNLERIRRGGM